MEPSQLLDNLSTHLKNVLARSIAAATSMQHPFVGPLHLLLSLLEEKGSIAAEILSKSQLDRAALLEILDAKPTVSRNRRTTQTATVPELDPAAKKALEKAMLLAYEREHNFIGTEHLLYGLLEIKESECAALLMKKNIDPGRVLDQVDIVLQSTSRFPDMDEMDETLQQLQEFGNQQQLPLLEGGAHPQPHATNQKQRPSALHMFTTELTNKQHQNKIDPVIGREEEIERLIHILCRRTKNNPVLVGEPGVGKTAIVEGLAKRIAAGDVPDVLKDKHLYSLDLTLLISGTIYRGEFEARLKQLIDEFAKQEDAILFIDELHNIIGAGSNQGTMDAANILKPALARGQLRCIGATTIDEYKKYITGDPALERRFQSIQVNEPTTEESVEILSGIKQYYETFHNTTITTEAIRAAVELANKYIHDTFLPDKAIDLLDEAAAAVRVRQKDAPALMEEKKLRKKLKTFEQQKEKAIHDEAFDTAMALKEKIERLKKKIAAHKKEAGKNKPRKKGRVTRKDIVTVLAKKRGVEPSMLMKNQWEQLTSLPKRLKQTIVGQDKTVDQLVETLQHAHIADRDRTRPLASLLFTGPSGVGKTALSRALAKELHFDEKALIKIDMSEFAEAHGVSKLLGSPAGYVGYKERNHFLDALRARPHAVVVFDEFDKAHGDVRKLLLQILDEGELRDSGGRHVSFRHAVVILTSNVGTEYYKSAGIGFGQATNAGKQQERDEQIHSSLKETFGATLLGRLDRICLFDPLTMNHVTDIVKQRIEQLNESLTTAQKISVVADEAALVALARDAFDQDSGARHLEHIVERTIHQLILPELKKRGRKKNEYTLTKTPQTYKLV